MTDGANNLVNEQDSFIKRHRVGITLVLILVLAGVLRFIYFGESPPGINQDEGVDAWNAYCLLKTGKDQVGASWPIFYMRGIGSSWSTLYIYLLIPFQAIGGLSITTTRIPPALFGVLGIALMYYAGKRLFNEKVGLFSALLLTLNPWYFQESRWGHESTIAAQLGLLPLALMLWANIIPGLERAPRPIVAGIGGLLSGIGCYGYQPVRVFVPIFLFLIFILSPLRWLREMKKPKFLLAVIIFAAGFMVFFGPLLWQHIFHPHEINRHFYFQPERIGTVGLYESIRNTLYRYGQHFSPNFLFTDIDYISPPGEGLLSWYMVPLFAAGLIASAARLKTSVPVRITIAFILAYPVGDILAWGPPLSSVRSVVGLCGIILLAAIGGVDTSEWLRKRHKAIASATTAAFFIIVLFFSVRYFHSFFGTINSQNDSMRQKFNCNLVEACEWIKPRFEDFDAIIFAHFGITNTVCMVTLGYDPNRWFNDPKEIITLEEWDYYIRCGKMFYMHNGLFPSMLSFIGRSVETGQYRPDHILLVIRPFEVGIPEPEKQILHIIFDPDGIDAVWLCIL